jgi:hypothetical protein
MDTGEWIIQYSGGGEEGGGGGALISLEIHSMALLRIVDAENIEQFDARQSHRDRAITCVDVNKVTAHGQGGARGGGRHSVIAA